jgi:hypothetical protein
VNEAIEPVRERVAQRARQRTGDLKGHIVRFTKGGVGMHPRGARSGPTNAFQLSYQENGKEKSGWLGKKQAHGKDGDAKDVTIDLAVFVPGNDKNELPPEALVLEEVTDPTGQRFYRIPGAPENEHCSQHLYLAIITDGNENRVGFSGCWAASSWNLQLFDPQWFAGTVAPQGDPTTWDQATKDQADKANKEQQDDEQKFQAEARKKLKKLNLMWLPRGKRLALGKDNTLICLCDPVKPTIKDGKQLRDKPDPRVLTVNLIHSPAPPPKRPPGQASVSPAVTAEPSSVKAGQELIVKWENIPNPTDQTWVGLYKVGAPDSPAVTWERTSAKTSGDLKLKVPDKEAGNYEIRLFQDDTWPYARLATSSPITVTVRAVTIVNVATGKVIENKNSSQNGDQIIQWANNGAQHQKWLLEGTGDKDGSYFIVNVATGKVIENKNSSQNGDQIIQWANNGAQHQKWLISSTG